MRAEADTSSQAGAGGATWKPLKIKREVTSSKHEHSPESLAGDKYEPGDFIETNCHWKDCGLEFGAQDILVKVSGNTCTIFLDCIPMLNNVCLGE